MKVVVVSGIWPPDVGGPASHAPALAAALLEAGHEVEVVTTADRAPAPRPYPVRWVPRGRPAPLRHLAVVRAVRRAARDADRVYATTMVRRSAVGAALARRPLIVKLVADEAYERERRTGRFAGSLEEFQAGARRPARADPPRHPHGGAAPGESDRRPELATSARSRSGGDSTRRV